MFIHPLCKRGSTSPVNLLLAMDTYWQWTPTEQYQPSQSSDRSLFAKEPNIQRSKRNKGFQ